MIKASISWILVPTISRGTERFSFTCDERSGRFPREIRLLCSVVKCSKEAGGGCQSSWPRSRLFVYGKYTNAHRINAVMIYWCENATLAPIKVAQLTERCLIRHHRRITQHARGRRAEMGVWDKGKWKQEESRGAEGKWGFRQLWPWTDRDRYRRRREGELLLRPTGPAIHYWSPLYKTVVWRGEEIMLAHCQSAVNTLIPHTHTFKVKTENLHFTLYIHTHKKQQ